MNRREALGAALGVEGRKLLAARVPLVAAALLIVGVVAICLVVVVTAASGPSALIAKLGPLAGRGGWPGLTSAAMQVTAAGGFLACGTVAGWLFGREFAEGTVAGLFALPVRRADVAMGKLLVYLAWALVVAMLLPAALVVAGLAAGFGAPGSEELAALARLAVLMPLTALMATPAALIATLARGLLGGIAATVVLVASAQVFVLSGVGAWFPPAAPALWAMAPDQANTTATLVALWLPVVSAVLIVVAWRRLQLDRS
ncbi:ABC transporter permease [Agromyces italicus]|uniref:ABC transporter permease n=1 Tax=Agromyces italicus TaxID=279572 RepID=UPI0003B312E5|nr:ABC transporter permease [Agromyces italicus]